jgi:hypothetical protein
MSGVQTPTDYSLILERVSGAGKQMTHRTTRAPDQQQDMARHAKIRIEMPLDKAGVVFLVGKTMLASCFDFQEIKVVSGHHKVLASPLK